MLVAIVGMSGSGKSVASSYLEEKGFKKIYFGGVVLEEVKKRGLECNPVNEKKVREDLRKEYGMSAVAKLLLPKIEEAIGEYDTVLDGLYSWDEYLTLVKKFKNLKLLAVVADKDLRYERVANRKERPLNSDEIRNRDYSEIENLAKGGPIANADYYIFNNGTINEYYERLDDILDSIRKGVDNNEKND